MWYNEFNGTFFITMAGIVAGVLGVVVNGCLKSKCSSVSCLGFSCSRAVDIEEKEHEFDVTHPVASAPSVGSVGQQGSVGTLPV